MAKAQRKTAAALKERMDGFNARMPSGQQCHRPGSQNRKKGWGGKRAKR